MAFDALVFAGAVVREVRALERDGKPMKAVVATVTYPTDIDDLWQAVTTAERIKRWFLPISGELKLNGRYKLEGNASGTITACDAPRHFASTWEFGGGVTWLDVSLAPDPNGGTRLELVHTAELMDHWKTYGPGAVGIGWDLGLMGLARHIESPATSRPPEAAEDWAMSAEAKALYRASSEGWRDADIAAGEDPRHAAESAETTRQFYSGETPPAA